MKIIVLFSGGLDSTTLLYKAVRTVGKENVIALSLFYGQKHAKELEYSNWTCEHLGVSHITEDMSNVFRFNPSVCSLLQESQKDIETGTYAEQQKSSEGRPVATYVPYRNGLFLSYAAALALQLGASEIWYGAHKDDAAGSAYPDCSFAFVRSQAEAIQLGTGGEIMVKAPWVSFTKADIVSYGIHQLEMSHEEFLHTWSCYNGQSEPCKVCGTCLDRKQAFLTNGITDID